MVNKPKTDNPSSLRTPGPKKKLGLVVPPALRMPHEDLIAQRHEAPPVTKSMPSQTTQTRRPSRTRQTSHTPEDLSAIAPQRDFMRAANSIVREVVSGGYFKGKSKQLYDCLYLLTRGAIVPSRRARISRPKLMSKAHIGSRVTFDANIAHLKAIGLIRVINITGEHEGNEYEVFLPEEVSMPSQSSMSSQTGYAQKVDVLDSLESSQTSHTSSQVDSITSDESQTFSKDSQRTIDDDAMALAPLRELERELTGKESSSANWNPLFELLITEAKIAAARTGQVSSVPAFLTEHLRRRLWKEDRKSTESRETSVPENSATEPSNVKDCPDCGGSGLFYPDGYEKGVTKCKHEKLRA